MIAKSSRGSGFNGLTNYLYDGKLEDRLTADKKAELITHSDNLRVPFDAEDLQGRKAMIRDFQSQSSQKFGEPLKQTVGHHTLNFNPKDNDILSPEMVDEITCEYIKERGLSNTQYIAVRHYDTNNTHVHIAFNRVDNDGKTLDSNNYIQNTIVSHDLCKKHGLTQPETVLQYVEKLEKSDPYFRENIGRRASLKVAEESKSIETQLIKESNASLNNARNMHHLSILCKKNGENFEKSEDGKSIKIDNKEYTKEDLEPVFKLNRDLAVIKSKKDVELRQRETQETDFKVKINKQTQHLELQKIILLQEKERSEQQRKIEIIQKSTQHKSIGLKQKNGLSR